ncbi:MAG: RsmB/NOP family class I SAM-dependent RNA methyltransferase [Desulfurococcaceae archaeon]
MKSVYEIYRDIYIEPSEPAIRIAVEHGYLPYMVQRYIDMLGYDEAIKLIKAFNKPVKPVVRTNDTLIQPERLRQRLENLGFELREIPWAPGSFWVLKSPLSPSLGATHEYLKGYYYVHRDATSLIPVLFLLHDYSGDVLDACAAPGGKATFIAQILRKRIGLLYANDLVLYRLKSLIGHLMRMRLNNVIVMWSDAAELPEKLGGKMFERILLDAPCSGEGTISVDPARKTKTSLFELAIMVKREIRLLNNLLNLLKEGGLLVYTTCSIAPEENEYVIDKVLKHRQDIDVVEPPVKLFKYSHGLRKYRHLEFDHRVEKCIRVWPHIHGLFGFTICILEKTGRK